MATTLSPLAADALQDLFGGAHADIGRNERVFQLIEQVRIDLLAALQRVFQAGNQPRPGLLHSAFQFFEQGWLLRDRAK